MTRERQTALFLQIDVGLRVARDAARRTGRPHALDLTPDNLAGSNRDADLPPYDGHERVHVWRPGDPDTEEFIVGVAKKLYTARSQGDPLPADLLRTFGVDVPARPPVRGHETERAVVAHLKAGPKGDTPGRAATGGRGIPTAGPTAPEPPSILVPLIAEAVAPAPPRRDIPRTGRRSATRQPSLFDGDDA